MLPTNDWVTVGIFILSQAVLLGATIATLRGDSKIMKVELQGVKMELGKLGNVLVELAKQDGRINRVEDRQLAQGMRLDDVERRLSHYIDTKVFSQI